MARDDFKFVWLTEKGGTYEKNGEEKELVLVGDGEKEKKWFYKYQAWGTCKTLVGKCPPGRLTGLLKSEKNIPTRIHLYGTDN